MTTLDHVFGNLRHVVAQVVETKLVIRAIRDVTRVHLAALRGSLPHENTPTRHTQEVIHTAHKVRLVLCQVVVNRHDMHTLTGQRAQVRRHRSDQGLTFTGLHFRDLALV